MPNRCLSAATSFLYEIAEAAVLAADYAPAVGFIHTGKPLSFVYNVEDLFKVEMVVLLDFSIAAKSRHSQSARSVWPAVPCSESASCLRASSPPSESSRCRRHRHAGSSV